MPMNPHALLQTRHQRQRTWGCVLVLLVLLLPGCPTRLYQPPERRIPRPTLPLAESYLYSVLFACSVLYTGQGGYQPFQGDYLGGQYGTAINVHNFHSSETTITIKAVSNGHYWDPSVDSAVGPVVTSVLPPNHAMRIRCTDIGPWINNHWGSFRSGFVEIVSPVQLSVVAAYTGKSCNLSRRSSGFTDCEREITLDVVPQAPFRVPGEIAPPPVTPTPTATRTGPSPTIPARGGDVVPQAPFRVPGEIAPPPVTPTPTATRTGPLPTIPARGGDVVPRVP
jgi:hypothetical protein